MTKEERRLTEAQRFQKMKSFERKVLGDDVEFYAGIDEVGRGPLAGPVVAAAVVLPRDFNVHGINDSKKLSEKRREELFEIIKESAIDYSFGVVDNRIIDEINILQATKLAMRKALANLVIRPDHILIDAVRLEDVDIPQTSIIKGDEKSLAIAAASIMAKVKRDHMMEKYAETYPGYAFEKNKGYGTKAHYDGIEQNGITPIHRKSFLKNLFE